ncbi:MAG: metallophosphoesterase [Pelagibacterium sp.]|uniref:metallophosphoesterase n=1 Tax=Pelagibacterium sp. TaxID=1967288 RepID=UPI0032EE64AA
MTPSPHTLLMAGLLAATALFAPASAMAQASQADERLLTDPFLQLPTEDGVHVVWFTEFEGEDHAVMVGEREFTAETMKMSRLAEDNQSWVGTQNGDGSVYAATAARDVWRHEAYVDGLNPGERQTYFVRSADENGETVESREFSLAPLPAEGQPLRILLTSDHQLKPMTPTNMQKIAENVGELDAVFFSGDLQNIPDRASEWFDDNRGFAFFPGLQGHAAYALAQSRTEGDTTFDTTTTYHGGELIQNAPLFPVIGNHEVMGRYNPAAPLGSQFNDPRPRAVAEALYEANADLYNPTGDAGIREQWIADNSFNTTTYEEIFTLPADGPGEETYYAIRYGDVFMIGLYGTRIWRSPSQADGTRGKFREAAADLNTPDNWGWGEFIFEDMAEGSEQYDWLVSVLESEEFKSAPVKLALMHHPAHGMGDNSIPAYAHPEQILDYDDEGRLTGVRYDYPLDADVFVNHVEPLLSEAGVQLVHTGHSHVWYRFVNPQGMNILETSNVGNNYGCYIEGHQARGNAPSGFDYDPADYAVTGDPHGYEPVMPTEFSPMTNASSGQDLPCIASNEMTAFSVLETGADGTTVSSYVFDTTRPEGDVELFDRFELN